MSDASWLGKGSAGQAKVRLCAPVSKSRDLGNPKSPVLAFARGVPIVVNAEW